MLREVKVPDFIVTDILQSATIKTKYQTNDLLKLYGTYFLLKSETTSGMISDLHEQIKHITKLCKCSKSTLYARLRKLAQIGLVTKSGKHILLSSWRKLQEIHDPTSSLDIEFYTVNYDLSNPIQTIEYLIRGLEIARNQNKQVYGYASKIKKNPHVKLAVSTVVAAPYSLNGHENAIKVVFANGGSMEIIEALQTANPNLNRNAASIRKAQGFRSRLCVTYLKRQLTIRGIAHIEKPKSAECVYSRSLELKETHKAGKSLHHFRNYDRHSKTATLKLADKIFFTQNFYGGFD